MSSYNTTSTTRRKPDVLMIVIWLCAFGLCTVGYLAAGPIAFAAAGTIVLVALLINRAPDRAHL
jgi:hypothetical protein